VTATIALLRAVNVGGTGKLPMAELKAIADELGLANARTYIASGNLLFDTDLPEVRVKAMLEERLEAYAGKPVGVLVRSGAEMARVATANPFADAPGNRVVAIFLDQAPPPGALDEVRGQKDERIALGAREIYVHYGDGMADSRLVIPAAKAGTARNMNTVAKLASLAGA
jgi:uncharacterized protein (DUF1697 family)